jgi:hypothetical protein
LPVLFVALALHLFGCSGQTGYSPDRPVGRLEVGHDAQLISYDGSEIILDPLQASAASRANRPTPPSGKAEKVKVPGGTTVLVKAIIGDDAQIEIKEGPNAGSLFWVECVRLKPLAN